MFIIYAMAAGAAAASNPAPAVAAASNSPISARSVEKTIVGGAWTGKLLQKEWIFEFRNEDGRMQGRLMASGGRNWQPLHGLAVSGRSVSFGLESKPKMSFSLEVGDTNHEMAGTVTLDGLGKLPFSATRTP
ncbi:MAG: hypothetical protein ACJ8ER_05810 [Allosphingosinicella sp.]